MARLVLKDIEREGVLTGEALREVRGGARAATRTGGSQTDHGRVTNDPSANNPNAHDHQTDGIHDDNGRIGNNGLGRQGRSGGSTGGSAARPTGGGSTAAPRIKWNATVLLAEKPKSALPTGQKAASTVRFEETVSKYVSGNVSVEVVRSVTLSSGADTKVRDAFTFSRKGGVKGYGLEIDTAVQRATLAANTSSWTLKNDAWIQRGGSVTWTGEDGKSFTEWRDPLALDLDGDGHVSTTGVGRIKVGEHGIKHETMQKGYIMDFDGDGKRREAVSFVTGRDAYLAVDRNGDGLITKGSELFGPTSNDGIKELAALDSNRDGKISALDKDFSKIKLVRVDVVTTKFAGGYAYGKNYQMLGLGGDIKVVNGAVQVNLTDVGYTQKIWSLKDEGIEEIGLATLSRARAEFSGTGVSASVSTADEAQARNLLREARDRTGIDMAGARVIVAPADGGTATPTADIAQAFRAAQPATGLSTGGRGGRDTAKRA